MKRSSRSKKNVIVLKQKNAVDKIINFFMNTYWSKKLGSSWTSWEKSKWNGRIEGSFRVLPSTLCKTIKIQFWNSLARYRNCKMKLTVRMIQEIVKVLNQYAVDIPTLPVDQCLSQHIRYLKECWGLIRIAAPQRRAAMHLGYIRYIRKRFCTSTSFFVSSVFSGIKFFQVEHMEKNNRGTNPHVYCREKWKTKARLRSEMPVWTVSQKFSHPQWGRCFKELWCRPTTTADFRSSFWQVHHTINVCLLEDKIQKRGMYLFTISYGSYAMDQRSGDGWFSGWSKIFVINKRYFNAEFASTWCEDCFSAEQNHPQYPVQKKGQSGGTKSPNRGPFPSRKTDRLFDLRILPGHWSQRFCRELCRLVHY